MEHIHVLVHDYAGHPFTVEFARALANKGTRTSYAYFAVDGGPKGRNEVLPDDSASLQIFPMGAHIRYSKTNFMARRRGDIEYGRAVADLITRIKPDVVLTNAPPDSTDEIFKAAERVGAKLIFWCQDVYSVAIRKIVGKKFPPLGYLAGNWYEALERRQMTTAHHLVHITSGFLKITDGWGIPRDRVSVIPNWGVSQHITPMPRDPAWAAEQGLVRRNRVLYTGTLARKHNPDLLLSLGRELPDDTDVVVVGFGTGADQLAGMTDRPSNLTILPLQPFDRYSEVLASADVLIAVIEQEAGAFSVPSKVLSYLCAGKPIVLAAPADNQAAQMVRDANAGIVVRPTDQAGFVDAVSTLLANPDMRSEMGANGRAFADRNFEIEAVVARFEEIFSSLVNKASVA